MQANRRPHFSLTLLPSLLSTYLIFSETLERREIVNLSPFGAIKFKFRKLEDSELLSKFRV